MSVPAVPAPSLSRDAEAARYALLRRLGPSMRHHLVVNLQPIGMIYEVMDRRLRAPMPDLANVQDSASKINGFAKAALHSCLDVVSWLAPDETATIEVPDAVRECTGLLATSLSFRGYALRNEVEDLSGLVNRPAIRILLAGAMIHLTDERPAPADLLLKAVAEEGGAVVTVTLHPTQGDQGIVAEQNYRKLVWQDVQALAEAEGVRVEREGEQLSLHFPWAAAG